MLTSPSGKVYIGQTIRPIEDRLKEHQKSSSNCVAIYNAIQKYGWNNFEKHWYDCPDEDLDDHENMMVEVLGTFSPDGYNLKKGGGNGKLSEETKNKISKSHIGKTHTEETRGKLKDINMGKTLSKETKQKMSESRIGDKNHFRGKTHTDEAKKKMREAQIGKELSDETKEKISAACKGEKHHFYGKSLSEEHKQKLSEAHVGKTLSDDHRRKIRESNIGKSRTNETRQKIREAKSKRVYQYNMNDDLIQSFASTREAARGLNKSSGSKISNCANGMQKSAYGFKWSYTKL